MAEHGAGLREEPEADLRLAGLPACGSLARDECDGNGAYGEHSQYGWFPGRKGQLRHGFLWFRGTLDAVAWFREVDTVAGCWVMLASDASGPGRRAKLIHRSLLMIRAP